MVLCHYHPSSSRWPTWGDGPKSRNSFTGPKGCGLRYLPPTRVTERRGVDDRWLQVRSNSGGGNSDLVFAGHDSHLPRTDGGPSAGGLDHQAVRPGANAFLEAMRDPYAWHALKLTFITALVMVLVNVLTGTATAWVLVRYDFPARGLVNALIDLPFAVPTVVTGVMLVVLFGPGERRRSNLGALRLGGDLPSAWNRASAFVRDVPVCDPERAAGTHGAGSRRGGSGCDTGCRCVDDFSPRDIACALAIDPDRRGGRHFRGPWGSLAAW